MKFITCFMLFFSITVLAQTGNLKLSGHILDSKKEVVKTAEIFLYNNENQLIRTDIAQDGLFEFSDLKPQDYYLQIVTDGFSKKIPVSKLSSDRELDVVLDEKIANIEAVNISGKRSLFQIEKGNLKINVANSPLSKVSNSTDLLAKLPYISINPNEEGLSMIGKGVPLLYIDNQKVDFSTISALSVDDIQSVEIIRNPTAKYEAEGKAVVKISLKNSKKEGYSLKINETAILNKRFSNNFSVNFQQKKNKTEWKINAAYNAIQHWESNGFEYSVPSKNIASDYIIKSETMRPQTVFGANYFHEFNDGDYITIGISSNLRPDKGDNNTATNYQQNGLKTNVLTLNHQVRNRASINSIFNFNKQLKSIDANIFTGLQYNRESNNVDFDFYNNVDNSGYQFSQFRKQRYAVNACSGRIDIEKKVAEDYLLSFGGSFVRAEAATNNFTDYRNSKTSDYFKYSFLEENWASYSEFSGEKERFSFKGGIRLETTDAKGFDRIINSTTLRRAYTDWFPSAEISYKAGNDYVFTLNFNKNIEWPSYGDLASGGLYSSPYVEYDGNPNLLPTYTHTISATANIKKWPVNASVYKSKNPQGFSLVYEEDRNISKFTNLNFEKETGASIGVDVPFEYKKFTSQNSISLNYSKTIDSLATVYKSTPYLYVYTNNTLKLGKGFNVLMDGSWITKRTEGLYRYNDMLLVNFGLTKSVSNFDFTLRYNDIFRQNTFIQELSYNKIVTKGTFYGNSPVVSFGVKYNFGKISHSDYKEKTINENAGRI